MNKGRQTKGKLQVIGNKMIDHKLIIKAVSSNHGVVTPSHFIYVFIFSIIKVFLNQD